MQRMPRSLERTGFSATWLILKYYNTNKIRNNFELGQPQPKYLSGAMPRKLQNPNIQFNPATASARLFGLALPDSRMPSSDNTTLKVSIDDVLAFTEDELVEYMKQGRRPDGAFVLEPDGWGNLPKDRRDQLAERLR